MQDAADNLEFEKASAIRDEIYEIRQKSSRIAKSQPLGNPQNHHRKGHHQIALTLSEKNQQYHSLPFRQKHSL